jgi:signal transduction histidine kinase
MGEPRTPRRRARRARPSRSTPIAPQFDPAQTILPRAAPPLRFVQVTDAPEFRAGQRLSGPLDRAKRVTLTGVRVLDPRGVVVASSGAELGAMLDDLPEVQGALAGRYTVVGRERISDEPTPPLDGIRRRGQVRLFTGMPVFADGRVIAVVRLSRTGVDVVEALWLYRAELALALLLCVGLTLSVAYALSRAISRPVEALMEDAAAITRGEPRRTFRARGFVPAELFALSESLDALTRQLTERAEYVAAFAAQAGHELKTPLTSIRGAVELLAESDADMTPEERARFLRNISTDTRRMERLVFRLLELARIENAVTPPPSEHIDLRAWFGAVADRHGPRVALSVSPVAPATLCIAPEHLESAVGNLVDNALRHGGDQPVSIRVDAASEGGVCACASPITAPASARRTAHDCSNASSPPSAAAAAPAWAWPSSPPSRAAGAAASRSSRAPARPPSRC